MLLVSCNKVNNCKTSSKNNKRNYYFEKNAKNAQNMKKKKMYSSH